MKTCVLFLTALGLVCSSWGLPSMSVAQPPDSVVQPPGNVAPENVGKFLAQYCIDCHDSDTNEGGLDLSALEFRPEDRKSFDRWVGIVARVRDGEMPPVDEERPEERLTARFLKTLETLLVAADRQRVEREGRAVWRRLNRHEYENTLRDIFEIPWLRVKQILPEDGEAHRFNKVGEALQISHVQMARYMQAADTALRQAMAFQVARPKVENTRFYSREQGGLAGKFKQNSIGRATFPVLDGQGQPEIIQGEAPRTVGAADPEIRNREAVGVVSSSYEPVELRYNEFTAKIPARYQLRFNAYSIFVGPGPQEKWWKADRTKIFKGRNWEPVTVYSEKPPRQQRKLGGFDVTPIPTVQRLDTFLLAGETIRVDASRFFRSRPPNWRNPLATPEGTPGVAFGWMDVAGPIFPQWPTVGHKLLFDDLPLVDLPAGGVEVVSDAPRADARRLMKRFVDRVYRHPATDLQLEQNLRVVENALDTGSSFSEAMIAGYTTVLCSPGFLYLQSTPGALDDYALAERLALFLWNSEPDAPLRQLAASGKLRRPDVLKSETQRLLDDPRSRRFINAFCDYWLDLRYANVNSPDEVLFPDYYLDDLLVQSAVAETQSFVNELVKEDLPVSNIVDSEFAFLNSHLAHHYDLPPVEGVALRRVMLPANSKRGGLLTQASILKVTANGTTTSPVTRGVWIMERIVGKAPPPPPPTVPSIEPDTRGAQTIREQLRKHRSDSACNACHTKIDPVGFALENYDVMGGWRDRYRIVSEPKASKSGSSSEGNQGAPIAQRAVAPRAIGYGKNGQPFAFSLGSKIDASGEWLDGQPFGDLRDLKDILLQEERLLAQNMVEKLVVYATGSPVKYSEKQTVQAILDDVQASHFGLRSLIERIVVSDLFLHK